MHVFRFPRNLQACPTAGRSQNHQPETFWRKEPAEAFAVTFLPPKAVMLNSFALFLELGLGIRSRSTNRCAGPPCYRQFVRPKTFCASACFFFRLTENMHRIPRFTTGD